MQAEYNTISLQYYPLLLSSESQHIGSIPGRMNTEVRADKSIPLESIYVHVVQALSVFSRLVTASTHTSAHTCTYSKPPAHFCSANGLHTTT